MPTPFTDFETVKKVLEYRKQGMSFRAIATLMKKNVKDVYELYRKGIGKVKMRVKIPI